MWVLSWLVVRRNTTRGRGPTSPTLHMEKATRDTGRVHLPNLMVVDGEVISCNGASGSGWGRRVARERMTSRRKGEGAGRKKNEAFPPLEPKLDPNLSGQSHCGRVGWTGQ